MELQLLIWNGVLSFLAALFMWMIKSHTERQNELQALIIKTREELAREYVTKVDVHNDINRVLNRLDKLEEKIDAFMKERRNALN